MGILYNGLRQACSFAHWFMAEKKLISGFEEAEIALPLPRLSTKRESSESGTVHSESPRSTISSTSSPMSSHTGQKVGDKGSEKLVCSILELVGSNEKKFFERLLKGYRALGKRVEAVIGTFSWGALSISKMRSVKTTHLFRTEWDRCFTFVSKKSKLLGTDAQKQIKQMASGDSPDSTT